jgi:hypothetical protein
VDVIAREAREEDEIVGLGGGRCDEEVQEILKHVSETDNRERKNESAFRRQTNNHQITQPAWKKKKKISEEQTKINDRTKFHQPNRHTSNLSGVISSSSSPCEKTI